ncbi:hypothetical protein [Nonomuraea sp. NPDC046570]|uniref:hypothetical protein n=1 Tax=Nonomuraea sp. NPDC046570 TaxID=3155255 RepID=UPI0033F7F5D1
MNSPTSTRGRCGPAREASRRVVTTAVPAGDVGEQLYAVDVTTGRVRELKDYTYEPGPAIW